MKVGDKYDLLHQGDEFVPLLDTSIWVDMSILYYKELQTRFIDEIWKLIDWDKISERYHTAKYGIVEPEKSEGEEPVEENDYKTEQTEEYVDLNEQYNLE